MQHSPELSAHLPALFKNCNSGYVIIRIIESLDTQIFRHFPQEIWENYFVKAIPYAQDNDGRVVLPLLESLITALNSFPSWGKSSFYNIISLFRTIPSVNHKRTIDSLQSIPSHMQSTTIAKILPYIISAKTSDEREEIIPRVCQILAKCNLPITQLETLIDKLCLFTSSHPLLMNILDTIPSSDRTEECVFDILKVIDRNQERQADLVNEILWIAPNWRKNALPIFISTTITFRDLAIRTASHDYLLHKLNNLNGREQINFAREIIQEQEKLWLTRNNPLLIRAVYLGKEDQTIELLIRMTDIKKDPVDTLKTLSHKLTCFGGSQGLRIKFTDQSGYDQGGLSRQFMHELFHALVKTPYFIKDDNFYTPLFQTLHENLSESAQKVYEDIGNLFMYCSHIKRYPIGLYFKEEVFNTLLSFTNEELNQPFSAMNPDRLVAIQDNKEMKQLWNDSKSEEVLETIKLKCLPLHAIAKGMLHSRFYPQTPEDFAQRVQGELTTDLILKKLQFGGSVSSDNQSWVNAWIQESSKERLAAFIKAMTGSPSLSESTRSLTVIKTTTDPFFHTCGTQVDIPFDLFHDKEGFDTFFSSMVENCNNFNTG